MPLGKALVPSLECHIPVRSSRWRKINSHWCSWSRNAD